MENLKDLDKLTEPDPRHDVFVVLERPSQEGTPELRTRQLTEADQHKNMAALELSDSVPETVRSAFAVTRNLWLYGWFCWPFYTLADFHAILCLDLALAVRIAREEGRTDPPSWTPPLQKMLDRAIRSNWITDEGIAHAKRLREQWKRMREGLPEGWFGGAPDPLEESNQRYCRILLDTLPKMRDEFAHPKHYWHSVPGSSYLIIENVHGLIQQLFHREAAKP